MLSISQSNLGYYCFEWTATEQGPKIIQNKFIKINKNLDEETTFKEIIKAFTPKLNDESKSLSVVLHDSQIKISSLKIDRHMKDSYYIKWYEKNILGQEYLKEFENYYYPLESDKNNFYLIISIKKNYKNFLLNTIKDSEFDLVYLSVNLFSAATITKQIFKIKKNKDFLIWKVDKKNHHYFTYYYNDNLAALIKVKLIRSKLEIIQEIGESTHLAKINAFINNFIINKKEYYGINNVFIYHVSDDNKYINSYLNINKSNLKKIDISRLFEDKTKSYMPYIENGISLRGIDV